MRKKINIFKKVKAILCLSLIFIFFRTEGYSCWENEVDIFVTGKVQPLRESRPHLKRSIFPFIKTVEILDFIEEGKQKYGQAAIASSSHTAQLIIDVCDIVNLQHPDFKTRYDIFIEQWEDHTQLPFSLFSFDRIAQVFHYRSTLFNEASGSAYRQMIEKIVATELPILRNAFNFICNLNDSNCGVSFLDPNYTTYLKEINVFLDQIGSTSGKIKAAVQKEIRTKVGTNPRMRGLWALSAMAHDYLTLGRIEGVVNVVLSIPAFTQRVQREAFLASMIQIGELTTNKNLSSFVRQYMPTIPWEGLVHCRDAIEHQDEHGFNAYFEDLLEGRNNTVNFKDWQEEFKILALAVSDVKQSIWKNDPSSTFDIWLQKELAGQPLYGVIVKKPESPSIEKFNKPLKKGFRQTPLFKGSSELWSRLTGGAIQVTYDHIASLKNEITTLKTPSPNPLPSATAAQTLKFLQSYEGIEAYLWDRIRREAIHLHLSDLEKNMLIDISKNYFNIPDITKLCLALLNMEQTYLTQDNGNLFLRAAVAANMNYHSILPIFTRLRQKMKLTRQVCLALPFDNSKDLQQPARKELAKRMFLRTSTHLHDLAHGPNFEARMMQEMLTIPIQFAFNEALAAQHPKVKAIEQKREQLFKSHGYIDEYGYAELTPEGIKLLEKEFISSGIKFDFPKINPAFKKFGVEVINRFYERAHKVHLPKAIKSNPTSYLASVYTLSVGIGALKEWVLREAVHPIEESSTVEKLRDGRNFIAHGDLLRTMNSIELTDIQENLLTEHLEHCVKLNFTQ
ncbi:MAG: hypothetical protein BGO76_00325 [Caedibacter sp. 38-128]|nr:hypothetical protein [Holosporales bacterium]OJX05030.1 MAG: hypothetical protein BGO76_00325 [Caedibacter sp. 38-128]